MAEKTRFLEYLEALNPLSYKTLTRNRYKHLLSIMLVFLLLSLVLFTVLLVPKTLYLRHHINKNLNLFTNLSIDIEAEHNNRITINTNPSIVVDLNNATPMAGDIMITEDKVYVNAWPLQAEANLKDYSNLKQRSDSLSSVMVFFSLLMLPGILIITAIFFIIELIIFAFIFSILGLAMIRAFKRDLQFKKSFKIALLSSISLMIANAIFISLFLNFWIPIIIYFLFFSLCALASSFRIGFKETEKPIKDKHKNLNASKSRTQKIFGKSKTRKDDDDFIMLE